MDNLQLPIDVAQWTSENVCTWINSFPEFAQYSSSFGKNHIDGSILHTLTVQELQQDLGIASLGHRKKIIQEISALLCPPQHSNNNQRITEIESNRENTIDQIIRLSPNNTQNILLLDRLLQSREIEDIGNINIAFNFTPLEQVPQEDVKNICWLINLLKSFKETLENAIETKAIEDISNSIAECVDVLLLVLNECSKIHPKLSAFVHMLNLVKPWVLRNNSNRQNRALFTRLLKVAILILLKILEQVIFTLENNPSAFRAINQELGKHMDRLNRAISSDVVKAIIASGGSAATLLMAANVLLPILGFTTSGIAAGSLAAGAMGSTVASGSLFAVLQSAGVIGFSSAVTGGLLLVGAAVGGVGYLGYKYISKGTKAKEEI